MATPINSNEDQKKRTLDALEQRFKQAEAQSLLLHQQKENKHKRPLQQQQLKPKQDYNKSSSKVASTSTAPASVDSELNNVAYSELSYPVNQNLATADQTDNSPGSTMNYILLECLRHGDAAPKYLQASRILKNDDNYMLLDNFVKKESMIGKAQAQAFKRQAKRSKKHASLNQHKRLGSFHLPTEYHNFERFMPLHEMWKTYISQLVKNIGKNELGKWLLNADLHGAIILVAHCKVSAFSGVRGIIIRETEETFGIITQDNKFKVVPKKLSLFMLQAESWKITLHGDKLAERSMVAPFKN